MVILFTNHILLQRTISPSPLRKLRRVQRSISYYSSMDLPVPDRQQQKGFMDFPHISTTHRNLMVELVSTMETRLATELLPSSLPADVQYYQNESGSAQGTLHIQTGIETSMVDFILGSWLHCGMPTGSSLDITTLTAYLNSKTDAPRFLIEFLQSSPTSMIIILDLPPRKDPVLHLNYLNTFYVDTQLDKQRQLLLNKVPEAQPYFPTSLYIRCALSPVSVSILINCDSQERMDEIIRDNVGPVAKELLEVWLNQCARGGTIELGELDKADLEKRDHLIKKMTVEIDLSSSLPRLFGPDVAGKVIGSIQQVFKT
ncbi:hypothetical protein GIB67_017610 [Kingdonia uniflora]|uniref:Red chlorophyll catabolite reductase n=1 Tax=Kingdonia uniflora TaxID=39325 RepID=A0A7J7LN71_9MAGN|nr:hypothetical protein GIB67_017610 [Kingdonia uniflora]